MKELMIFFALIAIAQGITQIYSVENAFCHILSRIKLRF